MKIKLFHKHFAHPLMKKRSTVLQSSRLRWSQKSLTHQVKMLAKVLKTRPEDLYLNFSRLDSLLSLLVHTSVQVLSFWLRLTCSDSCEAAALCVSSRWSFRLTEGDHKVNLLLKLTFVFFIPEKKQIYYHTHLYSAFRSLNKWKNDGWFRNCFVFIVLKM